jgi:hypothetical protein
MQASLHKSDAGLIKAHRNAKTRIGIRNGLEIKGRFLTVMAEERNEEENERKKERRARDK